MMVVSLGDKVLVTLYIFTVSFTGKNSGLTQ